MQVVEQEMRDWIQELKSGEDESMTEELWEIREQNSTRLQEIIAESGWPSKTVVGVDGVAAAFSIIEYSPDTAFQQAMLPALEKAFKNDEGISGPDLALFEDRLLVKLNKKQKYGTQIYMQDNKAVAVEVENVETVDQLRAEKGLIPLATYLEMMTKLHGETE